MKSRLVASAALTAVVLLGATGCTFISPQATTIEYSPSDGVNVSDENGPIDVRNAFVVASEDGSVGNFIGAIVNPTQESATLSFGIEGMDPLKVTVPAGETVSLGADADPLRIVDLDTIPGATVEMHFQSGDSTGVKSQIPVLDGTLPYYADLVPDTAETTPSPTPTPSDTAAPAPAD